MRRTDNLNRNKTAVIVLFILAGFFIIAVAMIFNTSTRRESALKRQSAVEEKIKYLNSVDLTIYWIGDLPKELESLGQSVQVIKPEEISKDNMPIKSSTFHITVTDEAGNSKEIIPRNYSEYMLIVINTGDGFSEGGKEIIRNCIVDNAVPVIGIGGNACNLIGGILIHGGGYTSDYSMFYRVKEGYEEPYFTADAVTAGGIGIAEEFTSKITAYFDKTASKKWAEASERVSAANSSAAEAATATTTEPTESTSETTEKLKLLQPPD